MVARVLLCVFVCNSPGASERVWYGFALLACPYTRAWSDAYVCFCVCAMLKCVLLVCCVCVRVSCMMHVPLCVCLQMSESVCVCVCSICVPRFRICLCVRTRSALVRVFLSVVCLRACYVSYMCESVCEPCLDATEVVKHSV